jgi:hypothetical protein
LPSATQDPPRILLAQRSSANDADEWQSEHLTNPQVRTLSDDSRRRLQSIGKLDMRFLAVRERSDSAALAPHRDTEGKHSPPCGRTKVLVDAPIRRSSGSCEPDSLLTSVTVGRRRSLRSGGFWEDLGKSTQRSPRNDSQRRPRTKGTTSGLNSPPLSLPRSTGAATT